MCNSQCFNTRKDVCAMVQSEPYIINNTGKAKLHIDYEAICILVNLTQ